MTNQTTIHFYVEGQPKGKDRPRFNGITKTTYTPKATKEYEQQIAWACKRVMVQKGIKLIPKNIEVELSLKAYMKNAISKPDADNILKVVSDALNGIAYADDSQITRYKDIEKISHATKRGLDIVINARY